MFIVGHDWSCTLCRGLRKCLRKMFNYWKLIMDYQILILQFAIVEREQDFLLYGHTLKSLMEFIFAFNHQHFAKCLSIHVDDLMKLSLTCQSLYKECLASHFVLQKTENPFCNNARPRPRAKQC